MDTQNHFEGWAVVELFGHGKAIGFVTTEYFGTACMFRIDTPEREAREFLLEKPTYCTDPGDFQYRTMPKGTKVQRSQMAAKSRLVGPGSIFAINPCSEQLAKAQLEIDEPRPLIVLEIPEGYKQKALPGESMLGQVAVDGFVADGDEDSELSEAS